MAEFTAAAKEPAPLFLRSHRDCRSGVPVRSSAPESDFRPSRPGLDPLNFGGVIALRGGADAFTVFGDTDSSWRVGDEDTASRFRGRAVSITRFNGAALCASAPADNERCSEALVAEVSPEDAFVTFPGGT